MINYGQSGYVFIIRILHKLFTRCPIGLERTSFNLVYTRSRLHIFKEFKYYTVSNLFTEAIT